LNFSIDIAGERSEVGRVCVPIAFEELSELVFIGQDASGLITQIIACPRMQAMGPIAPGKFAQMAPKLLLRRRRMGK